MIAEGTDAWNSAGFATLFGVEGDFDVTANFGNMKLATPAPGATTEVQLQVELRDSRKTQVNAVDSVSDSGGSTMHAQIRQNDVDGKPQYNAVGSVRAKEMSSLRLTRRRGIISILGRSRPDAREQFISEVDASKATAARIKVLLHTGGNNRSSEMVVKTLEIRSAQ